MQTKTFENAGVELDAKIKQYMAKQGMKAEQYAEAMRVVAPQHPDLARRYSRGESEAGREFDKIATERARRVVVYQSEFNVNERRATEMVDQHDPKMRNVPLDAGDVLNERVAGLLEKGEAKNYAEGMQAALDADEYLKHCYTARQPYIQAARQYQEDPMSSASVRAITEPRPDAVATSTGMPAPEFTNTARLQLGAMLAGAKGPDGGIDIPLALSIANLVPAEVRAACGEALDEITRGMIARRGMRGQVSEAYPEGYRLAVAEHPALWTASQTGTLSEDGLRDLFPQWFHD